MTYPAPIRTSAGYSDPAKPALPVLLPFLAVLGISDPQNGDWGRLRAMQFAGLARLTTGRVVAHALCAILMMGVLVPAIGPPLAYGWLSVLVAAIVAATLNDRRIAPVDQRRIDLRAIRLQALGMAGLAAVWVIPIAVFGKWLSPAECGMVWSIMVTLMAGIGLGFAAVPLGAEIFVVILGFAGIARFIVHGAYSAAAAAACFMVLVAVGVFEVARMALSARIAEASLIDKSEVVSLLLREFEDGEADWLWQVDPARRVRHVSARFAFALGDAADDVEGKPLVQLIAGDSWHTGTFHPSLHDLTERLKRRESFSNVMVRVTLHGQNRWWELSASPRIDENGVFIGLRGVGSDVTARRESEDQIAYLARFDTLTGLPNRMQLTEALANAMRRADQVRGRCAFLMIDLDRFKSVNDTLGHLVGDRLLERVAARLETLVGDAGLAGRLGGDEFAVVLDRTVDRESIQAVAQRIITGLSEGYIVDHHNLHIGASVGSAIAPRDGATVETLMRNADLALYRAKDEGGGAHVCYHPALHSDAERRRVLEVALRHALDRQELSLVYQPVVDATTGALLSFEALARWTSPEHGAISPVRFIPVAEEARLIVQIGEWALRTACHQAARWPSPVKVAVNVSGEQLHGGRFAQTVVSALAASGLAPHRLEIEVTESVFLRDSTAAIESLQQIIALGCGLSLDDFGTGYSALGYLRKIRFSTIKIDRSFVEGAARKNRESLAILRAVVAMADSLEMVTTAEGVETEEELAIVRHLGCNKVQGYLFGQPMAAQAAYDLVTNASPENDEAAPAAIPRITARTAAA